MNVNWEYIDDTTQIGSKCGRHSRDGCSGRFSVQCTTAGSSRSDIQVFGGEVHVASLKSVGLLPDSIKETV